MKVFIVEDEAPALENLKMSIQSINNQIEIIGTATGVSQSIEWLSKNHEPDLILLDIQLSDGIAFHILKEGIVKCPVIFITAYDKYLVDAFEYNCIDYLLKPVERIKLANALNKYQNLQQHFITNYAAVFEYMQFNKKNKTRIIVKKGIEFLSLKLEDIVYFFTEHKLVFAVDKNNRKFLCETNSLADIEASLDDDTFFRTNRQYIVNANYITKFRSIDKSKISIDLVLPLNEEMIVSQENAASFKRWISKI